MKADELRDIINELIVLKEYDQIKEKILAYKTISERCNDLSTIFHLFPIYESEKAAGQKTIFEKVENINQLITRYTILKFYLRRMDFGILGNDLNAFFRFLIEQEISSYELKVVVDYSVVNEDKVWEAIRGMG